MLLTLRFNSNETFIYLIKIEDLHQKYGLYSMQNGSEIQTGKSWVALQFR
jgi:hypothetical protein